MSEMTQDELNAEYGRAIIPYTQGGGAIKAEYCGLKSWRYFLEINSACNLRCPSCAKGNTEGYEHKTGFMDMELMEKILDKIQSENPTALVLPYGNSEPFLHVKLPECVTAIKRRGLDCEVSSNLNHLNRVDDFIAAGPDMLMVSVSGFTQDVYQRGHAGGDIEKVKANMKIIAEANTKAAKPIEVKVNYHVYTDNEGDELESMRQFAVALGFGFFTSLARAISMENAIQYLRHIEEVETGKPVPFAVRENEPDYNHLLPPVSEKYIDLMARLKIPPTEAVEMYEAYPVCKVCPVGDMFTFIRHDGKASLCACVADRRLVLGDYLDIDQETLSKMRRGHPLCQQCLKYRMNLYFHIVDRDKWYV